MGKKKCIISKEKKSCRRRTAVYSSTLLHLSQRWRQWSQVPMILSGWRRWEEGFFQSRYTPSAVYSEEREQGRQESHNHEDEDHTKPNSMENEKYIESNTHTPRWLSGKRSACQFRRCRRCEFDPWVGKIPWRRNSNPLQYFCLENSTERGALVCYSA